MGKLTGRNREEIDAQIRAFEIWPGAFSFWKEKRIKIIKAEAKKLPNEKKYDIGKVVVLGKNEIAVTCGSDFLVIKELQIEGKKPMGSEEFLKGHPGFVNSLLK